VGLGIEGVDVLAVLGERLRQGLTLGREDRVLDPLDVGRALLLGLAWRRAAAIRAWDSSSISFRVSVVACCRRVDCSARAVVSSCVDSVIRATSDCLESRAPPAPGYNGLHRLDLRCRLASMRVVSPW